jgi:hypothetical protein
VLLEIFREPKLWQRDRANLRLVCKDLLPCATQALGEKYFQGDLRLNISSSDFVHLAGLCSSPLRFFLKSVHFTNGRRRRPTRKHKGMSPDYSAFQNIKFESHLELPFSARAFNKLLQQTKHLETFIFYPAKAKTERAKVDAILSSITSDCLSELVIESIGLSCRTLKGLLERHCDTIRKLSMCSCQVTGGTWIDLLQWISHNLPSLECLELHHLQEMKWRRAFDKYDYSDMMCETLVITTGKKNIDNYIASLR